MNIKLSTDIAVKADSFVECTNNCDILGTVENNTVIWQYDNLIFVGVRPVKDASELMGWLI